MIDLDDLEGALRDLGDHLDEPRGDELAARVTARLRGDEVGARRHRRPTPPGHTTRRTLLAIAAAVVIVAVLLASYAPTRTAIAQWFGVGAVEIRQDPSISVPPTDGPNPVPGSVPTAGNPPANGGISPQQLAAASQRAGFDVRLPTATGIGTPTAIEVDARGQVPVVVVAYPTFTLVELRSGQSQPVLRKGAAAGTRIEDVPVRGTTGAFITGEPHEIAYVGPDGTFQQDSVRRAGSVLLWDRDGVTYRIEGIGDLAEAIRIAESVP